MPGGMYRDKTKLEGQGVSPERLAAMQDIDRYFEKNPFDLERYRKIKLLVSGLCGTSNDLCELKEYRAAESLNPAIARLDELKTEMQMPVYEHPLGLGHERKTLVG